MEETVEPEDDNIASIVEDIASDYVQFLDIDSNKEVPFFW